MKPDTSPARSESLLRDITSAVVDHDQARTQQAVDRVLKTATIGWGGHPTLESALECGCYEAIAGADDPCGCGCGERAEPTPMPYCPRDSLGRYFRVYRPVAPASLVHLYSYDAVEDTYVLRQEMSGFR